MGEVQRARRSPLAGAAARFAAATSGSGGHVLLEEVPFLTQVNLRADPQGRAAGEAGLALGCALPLEPGTSARAGEVRVLWLGPDEWLVMAPLGSDVEARLRAAVAGEPASVTDVSAQRTVVRVAGSRARDLLAHGCSLDLHPRVFGAGACAQAMLARAQVVLVSIGPDPEYWVLARASFAAYVADWLLDAATEYLTQPLPAGPGSGAVAAGRGPGGPVVAERVAAEAGVRSRP
jgi:sarcosine oxidase subunit gamma